MRTSRMEFGMNRYPAIGNLTFQSVFFTWSDQQICENSCVQNAIKTVVGRFLLVTKKDKVTFDNKLNPDALQGLDSSVFIISIENKFRFVFMHLCQSCQF
jgi:hypothetical protein